MTTESEKVYEKLEEAGVYIQSDSSGVGHAWRDVPEDQLHDWILDQLYTDDGELVAGTEAMIGTVPHRLRACTFS